MKRSAGHRFASWVTVFVTFLQADIGLNRSDAADWRSLGPAPITSGPYTGRVSAVACSPTDTNRYFVAGADGGVWRTTDGGASWTPLTDHMPRCAMGALQLDPQDENTIYAGTGEANFANHSRYGVGLFKSTDGGDSWIVLAESTFAGRSFSRILVDPTNSSVLYAAITHAGGFPPPVAARGHPLANGPRGVFKSEDGGQTWVQLLNGLPSLDATDLAIDPGNPQVLYAAIGNIFGDPVNGIYKTTNGGAGWTKLAGGLPTTNVGRISVGVAPSLPSRLYSIITEESTATGGSAQTRNVYRSDDGGTTWTATNPGNFQATYGWYLSTVLVKPDNPDTVFVGGLNLLRSTNGGGSWSNVTPPHVDLHALAYDASMRFIAGDDGGVHRSTNNGSSWTALNNTLSLIQFYAGISLNRDDPDFILAGTQDNGTLRREGDTVQWSHRLGGDGGWTSNHTDMPDRYFAEFQGTGNLFRSTNTGDSFNGVGSGISSGDRNCFLPPHVIDPDNPNRMLYATHRIYQSTNAGSNFTAISGDLTGGSPAAIRALAIAPSNGQTVYAATNDGRVQVSLDGGFNWNLKLTGMPGWPRVTKEIAVDPLDDARAYLAVSWFDTDQILETTDFGDTWTPIDGDLPDVPVNTVAVFSIASVRQIFLGTDAGVYRSINGGEHWSRYGDGLPNVPVVDLVVDCPNNRLVAATEGRGAWDITLQVAGDGDGDGDVDLFDFAAFLACFSGPIDGPVFEAPGAECLESFDFDLDNDIDMHDFSSFATAFTGP